ncbi:MAG: hypothetical protein QCH35_09175 [Methanomicrobiaceae archaeon]|nr:hypothetical protein [Methanomicrobiaceae archaeon]
MGFAEDALYSYVERSLRRMFPEREGWEIKRRPRDNEMVPDYFVQKKRFGRTHRVLVEVALVPIITEDHIEPLAAYAGKMEKLLLPIEALVLVVPEGANLSAVPDDIDVLALDVLRVEGGDVIWTKKRTVGATES